ncbi:hypothetical protein L8C58_15075 [Streptomyces sp. CMAA1738]|nr:hypothetical protein [Streptomyces sp. CMAA1738]
MVIDLGVEQAARYGWSDPQPVDAALLPRSQRAERITDEMQMPLYACLTDGQRTEFARLVEALAATVRAGLVAGPAHDRVPADTTWPRFRSV